MSAFKRELLDALAPVGLKLDTRSFRPHLTLGRFRSGGPGNILEHFDHIQSDDCRLRELVLFKSDLTSRGALYTVLARLPMKDAPGFWRQDDR
jgi:2'-5' RNA ligase